MIYIFLKFMLSVTIVIILGGMGLMYYIMTLVIIRESKGETPLQDNVWTLLWASIGNICLICLGVLLYVLWTP